MLEQNQSKVEMPINDNSLKQKRFITKIANNSNNKGFKEFVEKLYSEVPHYDLVEMEESHLYDSAVSLFKTMKQRKANEFKVNIHKPSKNADYAVIEIINADVPFLIESIGNELKQQQ